MKCRVQFDKLGASRRRVNRHDGDLIFAFAVPPLPYMNPCRIFLVAMNEPVFKCSTEKDGKPGLGVRTSLSVVPAFKMAFW